MIYVARIALNEHEQKVLGFLGLRANSSVNATARALKMKSHVVHYTLRRLRDRGIVSGIAPYLDMYRHGVVVAAVCFNLETRKGATQQQALDEVMRAPRLSWLARLGGRFQLAASLRGRTLHDLILALAKVRENSVATIRDESVLLRTGAALFGRRYLSQFSDTRKILGYGTLSEQSERGGADVAGVDELDLDILRRLTAKGDLDITGVARELKLSPSTVNRRLRELERVGTIRGYVLQVRASALGMRSYRICIQMRGGITSKVRKELLDFCRAHLEVVQLEESIGEWHFEIEAEATDGASIDRLRGALLSDCGGSIERVELVELFEHLFYSGVPSGL